MGIENYYMNPPTKKSSKKKERKILIEGIIYGITISIIGILIFI